MVAMVCRLIDRPKSDASLIALAAVGHAVVIVAAFVLGGFLH